MAARNAAASNGHRLEPGGSPFPRFGRGSQSGAEWVAIDLGGHDVVSRLHLAMRPGAEAAGESRRALERLAGAIEDEQLETLRLLVTELVTNAVRHAGTSQWIELELDLYANAVRVEVTDRGPGFQPADTPQPHPDRPGGWGLCLVDRLADRWGVVIDGLTNVWFEVDRGSRGALST